MPLLIALRVRVERAPSSDAGSDAGAGRCGKGRAITREETEELRSVGGRRADRYGEITPKGFAALGLRRRLYPYPLPLAPTLTPTPNPYP